MGLLETKIRQENLCLLRKRMGPQWSWLHNYSHSPSGRILVGWKASIASTSLLAASAQHIAVQVSTNDMILNIVFVYGANCQVARRDMWRDLAQLPFTAPTIIIGDFNAVLHSSHRINGADVTFNELADGLDFMQATNCSTLKSIGHLFSWNNRKLGNRRIWSRIDHAIVNDQWRDQLPASFVSYMNQGTSDHCPLVVDLNVQAKRRGGPFKFLNFLINHPSFIEGVTEEWSKPQNGGPMQRLWSKLKLVKGKLKTLHSMGYKGIEEKISLWEGKLSNIQNELQYSDDSVTLGLEEQEAIKNLTKWRLIKEESIRQKSRATWLKAGDSNTAFFHNAMCERQARNRISYIEDEDGKPWRKEDDIHRVLVEHYRKQLGTAANNLEDINSSYISDGPVLAPPDHAALVAPVYEDEIKDALWNIGEDKAPGLDGFNSCFFKATWPIIRHDLCAAVKSFFCSSYLPPQVNCSTITLVPKTQAPTNCSHYRPISCCTTVYKIISKIITKRLKPFMTRLVSTAQVGFIPGRNLVDNVILAAELIRGYNRKRISPRALVKIDLKSAYDCLEWPFLKKVLKAFAFPDMFIKWVMACVTTTSFSVLCNGIPSTCFRGARGLRQGDPLSPFLFALAMEYLTRGLNSLRLDKQFNYHPRCKKVNLTHLLFADDVLAFTRADQNSISTLLAVLTHFSKASGLILNAAKCCVFFAGISPVTKELLASMLNCSMGTLPIKYLGLPLTTKKLTINQCLPLVESVQAKISHWANKKLSYAGRAQLIQTVVSGITAFWAQAFPLPKKVLKKIQSLCRSFLWSGTDCPSHKSPIAWATCCLPKAKGGINITDFCLWNKAAMAKLLWALAAKKEKLWVVWVHTYHPKCLQGNYQHRWYNLSWTLNKILQGTIWVQAWKTWEQFSNLEVFCIRDLYRFLQGSPPSVPWQGLILNNRASPRAIFFIWMLLHQRLPMIDRLLKWGLHMDPICPLCKRHNESLLHFLIECPHTAALRRHTMFTLQYPRASVQEEMRMLSSLGKKKSVKARCLVLQWTEVYYFAWNQRCNILFNNKFTPFHESVNLIRFRVAARASGDMLDFLLSRNS